MALLSVVMRAGLAAAESNESVAAAEFIRGVNLNGPAIAIGEHEWQAGDSPHVECSAAAFENQQVKLSPRADRQLQKMLRSSRWGTSLDVTLTDLPDGEYRLFLYVWEDNESEQYEILVNDRAVVNRHRSGKAGEWKRLGPWTATAQEHSIKVSARGGAANFSGIEVWTASGEMPEFNPGGVFNRNPSDEQLAFFESKIRPVLVERCYECHQVDAAEVGGELLLDSRRGIVRGGQSGPVVLPGDATESLLVTAIEYGQPELQMPPDEPLPPHQIADFKRWIELGAPDPRTEDTVAQLKAKHQINWEQARDFWSLRALNRSSPPRVEHENWVFNDIDRFVRHKLEELDLPVADDATREVWIRRATYDLTGLPPEPKQIDEFVSDASLDAYAKVVDRLLETPEYGERWGRHWLDVVRYSDTAGDNSDFPIPQMVRYRDWVIDAFNNDMPYDQFVREQLAGDLMPADSLEETNRRLVATGYLAGARRFGSRVSDYPQHLTIEDTIDNLGRAFLATTINCARCHDHKFDPITAEDYYALYGIFQSTRYPWPGIELEQRQRDLVPLVAAEEIREVTATRESEQRRLDDEVKRLKQLEREAADEEKKKLGEQLKAAGDAADQFSKEPLPFELAYAVVDAENIEDACVQLKGNPEKPGDLVRRRFLSVLGGQELTDGESTSGRLQLANWIVDRDNPLTARVMVNRIWLHHFGQGLAARPNDFGRQGNSPTHPELLDWLAVRFIESGWSIKSMHRDMMLSHTYRLASHRSEAATEADPTNQWLSSFPRRRLDAESIRDTLLKLSGNLDTSRGGPHPFPPQSKWKFTQHNPFKAIYDTQHRSVYLMTQRIQRHPYLAIFDGADPAVSTAARPVSTTPLQALYFLNDPFVHDQAAGFSERLLQVSDVPDTRLEVAYRQAIGRSPNAAEVERAHQLLTAVEIALREDQSPASEIERQAWQSLARSIFRLNEFVYLD